MGLKGRKANKCLEEGGGGRKNGNHWRLPEPCWFVIKLSCTQAVPAGLTVTFPCGGTAGSGEQGGLSTFYQQQLFPGLYEAHKLLLLSLVAARDGKAPTQSKSLRFKSHINITQSGVWYRGGKGERTWHPKSGVLRGKRLPKSSLGYMEQTGESQRGY